MPLQGGIVDLRHLLGSPGAGDADSSPLTAKAAVPRDLTDQARDRLVNSIERLAMGEPVQYSIAMTVVPGPQGEAKPMLAVVLGIPHIEIGQHIHSTALMENLWTNQESFDRMVHEVLEGLKQARSQMVSQAMGSGVAHPN